MEQTIAKTNPVIIKACPNDNKSAIQPNIGAITAKNARIMRLLIDSTVALMSEGAITFTIFFNTGVATPLTA